MIKGRLRAHANAKYAALGSRRKMFTTAFTIVTADLIPINHTGFFQLSNRTHVDCVLGVWALMRANPVYNERLTPHRIEHALRSCVYAYSKGCVGNFHAVCLYAQRDGNPKSMDQRLGWVRISRIGVCESEICRFLYADEHLAEIVSTIPGL